MAVGDTLSSQGSGKKAVVWHEGSPVSRVNYMPVGRTGTKHGVSGVPFTSADQHSAAAPVTDAPDSGKSIVPTLVIISVGTAMTVTLQYEGTSIVIGGPFYMAANTTLVLPIDSILWKVPVADKRLTAITSVSGNVMVDAHYYSE